jgi:alpha-L-glutamate ligase-like protein
MRWLLHRVFVPEGDVMGINRRNLELVRRRNQRRHFPLADDKLLTKEVLAAAGVPVAPSLSVFSSFAELGHLAERIDGLDEFVIKPASASGGRGIVVIAGRDGDGWRTAGGRWIGFDELRRHVADIVFGVYTLDRSDRAIIEPRLHPHPFFADLWPHGLSDVRIILTDDAPTMSMIRVPTRASEGRANLHQGALGLGLDLETGCTIRAWHRKRPIATHPDSGSPLLGLQVPGWSALLDIARRVAAALPLKYLGLDLVVDRNLGPLVLEVNARPGLEIQNVTGIPLATRLREMGALR